MLGTAPQSDLAKNNFSATQATIGKLSTGLLNATKINYNGKSLSSLLKSADDRPLVFTQIVAQDSSGTIKGSTGSTIQKAIDKVSAVGGGAVYVREGTYQVNRTIMLPNNVSLEMAGPNITILQANSIAGSLIQSSERLSRTLVDGFRTTGSCTGAVIQLDGELLAVKDVQIYTDAPIGFYFSDSGTLNLLNTLYDCLVGSEVTSKPLWVSALNQEAQIEWLQVGTSESKVFPEYGVFNEGFSTCLVNTVIFGGGVAAVYSTSAIFIQGSGVSNANVGYFLDVTAPGGTPFNPVLNILNATISNITESIVMHVTVGLTAVLCVNGLSAPGSGGFNFTGVGTHIVQVSGLDNTYDCKKDGGTVIDPASFINQGNKMTAVQPTPVLGVIYLDDGTNRTGGLPGWMRYNGAAYVNL